MTITIADKKKEAVSRMRLLKLFPACIKAFESRGEVQLSERTGALYEFSDNTWLNAKIKEFEEKHNALVYHVIHTLTDFGELYDFLYVGNDKAEWGYENSDLKDNYVFVWCENATEPMFSEFGTIGVGQRFGGLIRNL